jgi:hypothetical protein
MILLGMILNLNCLASKKNETDIISKNKIDDVEYTNDTVAVSRKPDPKMRALPRIKIQAEAGQYVQYVVGGGLILAVVIGGTWHLLHRDHEVKTKVNVQDKHTLEKQNASPISNSDTKNDYDKDKYNNDHSNIRYSESPKYDNHYSNTNCEIRLQRDQTLKYYDQDNAKFDISKKYVDSSQYTNIPKDITTLQQNPLHEFRSSLQSDHFLYLDQQYSKCSNNRSYNPFNNNCNYSNNCPLPTQFDNVQMTNTVTNFNNPFNNNCNYSNNCQSRTPPLDDLQMTNFNNPFNNNCNYSNNCQSRTPPLDDLQMTNFNNINNDSDLFS